jgi:DNA invertase Pin-like site-specific DNA recombinase
MKKAVCYIRVSTEEQAREGVSLAAQEERLRAYCRMAGLEIVEMVREEGVSGGKALSTRPGGGRLLGLLGKGKAQNVIALKLDRLFRDAEDALHQTKEWDREGIALHLVDMGGQTINTASAMGRFFLNMMAGFAELERNLIAERTGAALAHKKANGRVYSPTPYGFDREGDALVKNSLEQKIIKDMKRMRENGWSFGKIADALNLRGIPTKTPLNRKTGRQASWHGSMVNYILSNGLHRTEEAA